MAAKVLQEKDISVHVSVGNYDLGICGRDWVREMQARYPASALLEVACLDYREGAVYVATSVHSSFISLAAVTSANRTIRIASEYPSVATKLAAQLRLRRFQVFPVWGAADAYPPESADVIVLWARNDQDVLSQGLIPVAKLFDVDAVVASNDLSALGALAAVADEGLRVPDDVLVTGFDNDASALSWPDLTTVDPRLREQGAAAAERLLAEIDGVQPGGEILVPSRVLRHPAIRRGSPPPSTSRRRRRCSWPPGTRSGR